MIGYDKLKAWFLSLTLSLLAYLLISWMMVKSAMVIPHGSSQPIEIVITLPPEESTKEVPPKAPQKREESPKPQLKVRQSVEKQSKTEKTIPKTPPSIPIKEKSLEARRETEDQTREETGKETTAQFTKEQGQVKEESKKEEEQTKAAPPPSPKPSPSQKAQDQQNPLIPYLAQVRSIIERNKRYPEEAKRRGEEGTAVVRIKIASDGRVESVSLIKGSGSPSIDREVVAMIRRIGKFPPPPFAPMEFNLEVEYKLGG
ncbi:MAG: energy transducer TonB [Aquificaceae bacterium]